MADIHAGAPDGYRTPPEAFIPTPVCPGAPKAVNLITGAPAPKGDQVDMEALYKRLREYVELNNTEIPCVVPTPAVNKPLLQAWGHE